MPISVGIVRKNQRLTAPPQLSVVLALTGVYPSKCLFTRARELVFFLHLQAPVPVEPWSHTLDATKQPPVCVQRNPYIRQKDIVGQEDCLYLNIYSPYTSNVRI